MLVLAVHQELTVAGVAEVSTILVLWFSHRIVKLNTICYNQLPLSCCGSLPLTGVVFTISCDVKLFHLLVNDFL